MTDLGIEGAIRKIAEELQKSGYGVIDSENKINADIYEQILAKIKQSDIYKSLQYGTKTIGEMDLSSDKDVERLKQFAQAFGVTYEEALKLREEFGDLSTAMAYMTPQEVLDYYNNLTSIFNDLATNASLSADSINKILTDSNYQSLIPYLTQGTDVLQSQLYERLLGGKQVVLHTAVEKEYRYLTKWKKATSGKINLAFAGDDYSVSLNTDGTFGTIVAG